MTFPLTSSSFHSVALDFLTSSYRMVGQIKVSHTGIMGVMADSNSSVIEVQDAQLARLHLSNRLADFFDTACIVKKEVVVVCVNRKEDLGPIIYSSYNPVSHYQLHFITHDFEINGVLEWSGRFDIAALMAKGTRDFIPLENVNITAIFVPTLRIETKFALVNRNCIDIAALAVSEKFQEEV
jgi:hypothetical protein